MTVVPLGDGESYRLAELGVTLDADPWVVEVETFLFPAFLRSVGWRQALALFSSLPTVVT